MKPSGHNTHERPLIYGLAALPLFNCIVNQLNTIFHLTIGPLTMLQLINGTLLLFFGAVLVLGFLKDSSSLLSLPWPILGAVLLLCVACTEELVRTGTLTMASLAPYGQLLYWITIWGFVVVLCRRPREADLLLFGLVVGAVGTAISVFLGFALGTRQYYGSDAVLSSAGWFDTAKMITGILITGGVVCIYLGRRKHRILAAIVACFCFTACILTYARAGWVALAVVLVWLLVWTLLFSVAGRRSWLAPALITLLVAALALPAIVGPDKLAARWSDVGQGDQAGSGRATFWKIAFDHYVEATPAEQVFGRGYNAMAEMLFSNYGMDIRHTHNDLLDMLTVAGFCGAAWLLLFLATLFRQVFRSHIASFEGAAGMAIVLTYATHASLTGQLWGTDVMAYYTIAIACLSVKVQHKAVRNSRAIAATKSLAFSSAAA